MPRSLFQFTKAATLFCVLLTAACERESRTPAVGEAFAGPAKLTIRQEISLHSPVVATVSHGDRLEIISQRRRFTHVRTPAGVEGWVDERNLMEKSELAGLQQFSAGLRAYPSQGQATVYESVNVHTEAQRTSPSYMVVNPGEKVDVIGHQWVARADPPRKSLVKPAPKVLRAPKKPAKQLKVPLPARPVPPPPPKNWLELSKERSLPKPPPPPPAEDNTPRDEWSLIRNAAGQSGWVLTRKLTMAIPDEVAQYAEGHRITSYFALGKVKDGDLVKDTWLWTTIAGGEQDYDFDSFRVFIWSLRHHRYETAYIQRRIEGYAPVYRNTIDGHPGFSVCLESNAQRVRRQFVMIENLVKSAGDTPCAPGTKPVVEPEAPASEAPPPQHRSWLKRMVDGHVDLIKRSISGK